MKNLLLALGLLSSLSVSAQNQNDQDQTIHSTSLSGPCDIHSIHPVVTQNVPNSGIIEIQWAQGGIYPYTYSWTYPDGSYHIGNPITNLTQRGTYKVIVTDAIGCSSDPFEIELEGCIGLDGITVAGTEYGITTPTGSDGKIDIDVSGGSDAFSYSWTGPNNFSSTDQNIKNLELGSYTVVVTDSACSNLQAISTYSIPGYHICNSAHQADVSFTGYELAQKKGIIKTHINGGGYPPFNYEWTFPNDSVVTTSDSILSSLRLKGEYQVTITDSENCNVGTYSHSLYGCVEIEDLEIDYIYTHADHPNRANGAIDLIVSGGSWKYDVSWKGPHNFTSKNQDIRNLLPGTYEVLVKDQTCVDMEKAAYAYLWVTSIDEIQLAEKVQAFPSPNDGNFTLKISNAKDVLRLNIRNSIGQIVYQDEINQSQFEKQVSLPNTTTGLYIIELSNDKGQIDSMKMMIK